METLSLAGDESFLGTAPTTPCPLRSAVVSRPSFWILVEFRDAFALVAEGGKSYIDPASNRLLHRFQGEPRDGRARGG